MSDTAFDPMQFEEFRLLALNCEADPSDRSRFFPVADWLREHGDEGYADAWEWVANRNQVQFRLRTSGDDDDDDDDDDDSLRFWGLSFAKYYDGPSFDIPITRSLEAFFTNVIYSSNGLGPNKKQTIAMMVRIIQQHMEEMRTTLNPKDSN